MAIQQLVLESELGFGTWRAGRASVGKQGCCFLETVGAWWSERGPGGPRFVPFRALGQGSTWLQVLSLVQESSSRQQLECLQEGRYSCRGRLWERPRAWTHREPVGVSAWPMLFGPLSSCSLWCQFPSEAGGPADGPWSRGTLLSHLCRFYAVTVVVLSARQGAPWGRPATAEAVQGAAQRAQALPEPELGLTGAPRVVRHALAGPAAPRIQCSGLAEGHEQQTGGQQEEDAGQGNEHRDGVNCH